MPEMSRFLGIVIAMYYREHGPAHFHIHGEIFEPLRDVEYFRKFEVSRELGTVVWPNGADFAPEFLRKSVKVAA